jgi:preprotein translocase subunit SecE
VRKLYQYFLEVIAEGKKVTWPPRAELIQSTWVVMLFSLMCGLFITGIDLVMGFVVEQLLSSGA